MTQYKAKFKLRRNKCKGLEINQYDIFKGETKICHITVFVNSDMDDDTKHKTYGVSSGGAYGNGDLNKEFQDFWDKCQDKDEAYGKYTSNFLKGLIEKDKDND